MDNFNANQIEQFLQVEKLVIGSADHYEIAQRENFWGDDKDTISGITITTSLAVLGA